jgi:hypothetical protein
MGRDSVHLQMRETTGSKRADFTGVRPPMGRSVLIRETRSVWDGGSSQREEVS